MERLGGNISHPKGRVTGTFVIALGSYSRSSDNYARQAISSPAFEQLSMASIGNYTLPTVKFLFKSNHSLIYAHFCISQLKSKKSLMHDSSAARVECEACPFPRQDEEI